MLRRRTIDQPKLCSFCRKSPDQVEYLITSPIDVPPAYICDECVAVCNSILDDRREQRASASRNTIHTERLTLRPWRDSDREPFAAMNADPVVMQFFPSPWSREQSDAAFERIQNHWRDHGFGIWVVEIGGEFAGTLGLQHVRFEAFFTPAVELGYRFLPQWWNQGYATEAALAAVNWGFQRLPLKEIVAFAVKANRGSTRVMEKIGMHYDRDFDSPDIPTGHPYARHALYRLTSIRA